MRLGMVGMIAVAIACRPESGVDDPSPPADPTANSAPPAPEPTRPPAPAAGSSSIPDAPALVVRNLEGTGIEIYGAYLVDRDGERGTRMLWPHKGDCAGVEAPPHLVAGGGGVLVLPAPTEAYPVGSCEPAPLPPGAYVVRLDSGFGETLYAAVATTLPLTGPVELEMKTHDGEPPCEPVRARRAAILALRAAEAEGTLPPEFARECDVERAQCGALPLGDDAPPPDTCTVTLHGELLRIERAAGNDALRWLTAWADREVVYVQRPDVTRTSASRVLVEGKPVVIAGLSDHHRHEHGGDPAHIGGARFVVRNPLPRPVRLRVRGVAFMHDGQCGLPNEVTARPKPDPGTPSELPPGDSELSIGFAAQDAYQGHCDRFATRVTFEVEGKRLEATAEHEVMRFDPIRHR